MSSVGSQCRGCKRGSPSHAIEAGLTTRHSLSPLESDWCAATWACAEWWFSTMFSRCWEATLSRKAAHPSSPSLAYCPSGSHEEGDLLAAIFMMRAPPSRSSHGSPRRSAPSCSQSRGSTLLDSWLIRSTARLQHRQLVFDDLRDAPMTSLSSRARRTSSGGRAWVGRAALHITRLSHSHRSATRSTRARSHRWTRWGSLASTASPRRR